MITIHLIFAALGTILIRLLHAARRKIAGPNHYFSFADFIDEEKYIHSGGFWLAALPPLVGGAVMAVLPNAEGSEATAAGFLAAFLGVWPVLQHPYQVLDERLQRYWPKLRTLYFIFIGSSASLAYLGFWLCRAAAPIGQSLVGTIDWEQIVADFATNALYDLVKFLLLSLLAMSGLFAINRRQKIGEAALRDVFANPEGDTSWHSDSDIIARYNSDADLEGTA